MTFRLRQIDYTADGRRIVRDKDLVVAALGIGRAAENAIHLPDLAVEPNHARIELTGPGRVSVRALGSLGFSLDGKTTTEAAIDCGVGAELGFGTYRLSLSTEADGSILVEVSKPAGGVEHADPLEDKRAFSLAAVMPSKRLAGWLLAGLVLLGFLLLPVTSHLLHKPGPHSHVTGDKAWSPGGLSLAHHTLEGRCEACHVKPFVSVRNETCMSCHKDLRDHAHADDLAMARGAPGIGRGIRQSVAHLFGREGPGACTDCHTEHQGAKPMDSPRQQFCADCHSGLKERLPQTKLGNASDFGTAHPQFVAQAVGNADTGGLARMPLDGSAREDNGLTFSHRIHLDAKGGVARMAMELGADAGYGKALGCKSCHRPGEDGVRFQKIDMARDCEACHSLAYARAGSTVRRLRHGDVAQMVADLNAVAGQSPRSLSSRSRPGEYAAGQPYYANFAAPPLGIAQQALAPDGVCGECHKAQMRNGKLTVRPVKLLSRYMPNGWFDHAAHKNAPCAECHAAKSSTSATQLLLPGIAQCRTCHVGEAGVAMPALGDGGASTGGASNGGEGSGNTNAKVPSGCVMCHAYHATPQAPSGARKKLR